MTETPQDRISRCYYCERYRYKILGGLKLFLGDRLPDPAGWLWAIEFEEGSVREKYKEPTVVPVTIRGERFLGVRYFDEEAVCLKDSNLRNTNYRSEEAHERCLQALAADGWKPPHQP